jgi:hypothetical protein
LRLVTFDVGGVDKEALLFEKRSKNFYSFGVSRARGECKVTQLVLIGFAVSSERLIPNG